MRLSSLMEILATVGMSCILVWFGVSRPTSLEALVIYLLAVGALAGQGVIVRMRERLSHAVADTPHALWTLKAQQARLTRKIALLGLFAGPLGVLTGYALAIVFSIPGAAAGSSMPLLAFAVIALSGGMLHAALEARRAKRDLAEALETLSLLDDAAA